MMNNEVVDFCTLLQVLLYEVKLVRIAELESEGVNHNYIVKSYYKLIGGERDGSFPASSIWGSLIPTKVIFLIWTASWNFVLNIDN